MIPDPLRDVLNTFKPIRDVLRVFVSFTKPWVFVGAFLNFFLYFLPSKYLLGIFGFFFFTKLHVI